LISARDEDKSQGFEFVRNLLTLLLHHGLDPNVRFSQRSNHILLSLMDMVQNARAPKDLSYVYDLTLTLITYGANPNVIIDDNSVENDHDYCSMPATPPKSGRYKMRGSDHLNTYSVSPKNLVLYHYVQLLMRKNQLWIADPDLHFARILRIYYFAMSHTKVYASLRLLLAQTGMNPTKTALFSVIRDLHSKPRTLKQLARISIYNAIKQKPAFYANKLPLPPSLREYLMSFEP
jgi:hypothetical protein